jgi:DNA polymerase III epsilon subunit-like protein
MDYIRGAELVIHNASFDIGFMDYEFSKLNRGIAKTETFCKSPTAWRWRGKCSPASVTA